MSTTYIRVRLHTVRHFSYCVSMSKNKGTINMKTNTVEQKMNPRQTTKKSQLRKKGFARICKVTWLCIIQQWQSSVTAVLHLVIFMHFLFLAG